MLTAYQQECLKETYLEVAGGARIKGIPYGQYTFEMLSALRNMARQDVFPDARFGDEECNVWSLFRR